MSAYVIYLFSNFQIFKMQNEINMIIYILCIYKLI